jgi:uncharacterized protein
VHPLRLFILKDPLAICKLPPNADIPPWASLGTFNSVTRTHDELSIVCLQEAVPDEVPSERGWRALRIQGPLSFSMVGVLASMLNPLAEAEISVFVLSTFDTDYLFIKEENLDRALLEFQRAGHLVISNQ